MFIIFAVDRPLIIQGCLIQVFNVLCEHPINSFGQGISVKEYKQQLQLQQTGTQKKPQRGRSFTIALC
jgi:hypothetical protein